MIMLDVLVLVCYSYSVDNNYNCDQKETKLIPTLLRAIFPTDDDPDQKRFVVKSTAVCLIFATVIIPIILVSIWFENGQTVTTPQGQIAPVTNWMRIAFTGAGIVFLTVGWFFYAYLKSRK